MDLCADTAGHRFRGAIRQGIISDGFFIISFPAGTVNRWRLRCRSMRFRALLDNPARHEEPRQQQRHNTACRGIRSTSEALATEIEQRAVETSQDYLHGTIVSRMTITVKCLRDAAGWQHVDRRQAHGSTSSAGPVSRLCCVCAVYGVLCCVLHGVGVPGDHAP